MVTEPFVAKQSGATLDNDNNPICGTSITFALFVTTQPLPSVIVTEYVPEGKSIILSSIEPVDHK